ncbi:histidine kinase [Methylopila henanensis]|uniref:Histidine kinase n=1 Tax=Methylopila henanensis TaxID=873516 RepID=A0ABW4K9L6_9HYPH
MSLMTGLVLRIFAVVALCLAGAGAWTITESHDVIRREVAATAERVEREAKNLAWREVMFRGNEGPNARLAFPEWRTADTLRIISPGYCVTLAWTGEPPTRFCGGPENARDAAPDWFAALHHALFGALPPVRKTIATGRHVVGMVEASADDAAAALRVWRQVSVVLGVAGAMAIAIAVLATVAIGQALRPADVIVRGLKRLEDGDHEVRLPDFAAREFAHVARAFNDLTERLALTTAQRAAVTRRLFQVQEEERRALARDLHDEFGQCLTATRALAAAVAGASAKDRPDIAGSAREIGAISEGMAMTLRSALARLRPPEIDEIGLEQSLEQLVGTWNARTATAARRPTFRLEVAGNLDDVPTQTALTIYRVAQEGLTNAARHGAPQEVRIAVARSEKAAAAVTVTVEDDGGGDAHGLESGAGHGLLGIRERVDALGGAFTAEATRRGVRISARIPLAERPDARAAAREAA